MRNDIIINKLVSIIVPVFNAEDYIIKTIKSVLNQTYPHFQLILVDDESTDSSGDICDRFASQDHRISVIHQKNKGEAGARNTGLEIAKGDYIAFLDSDDWISERFLEIMVKALDNTDLPICRLIKVLPDKREVTDPPFSCDMDEWCWPIINNYSISCNRCIYNKMILDEYNIRFTQGRKTGEDQEFTYKYMLQIENVKYVPDAVYYYRINQGSAMFTANYNHFHAVDAMLAVEKYAIETCDSERAEMIKEALRNFKYPYILEFAILSVLTSGETPCRLAAFLSQHHYDEILDSACNAAKHWNSDFMNKWKKSPKKCLKYYYHKKQLGNILRKLKLR